MPAAGMSQCWIGRAQLRGQVFSWLYRCLSKLEDDSCGDAAKAQAASCWQRAVGHSCLVPRMNEYCARIACEAAGDFSSCDHPRCYDITEKECRRVLSAIRAKGQNADPIALVTLCYDNRTLHDDGSRECSRMAWDGCIHGEPFRLGTQLIGGDQWRRWRQRLPR